MRREAWSEARRGASRWRYLEAINECTDGDRGMEGGLLNEGMCLFDRDRFSSGASGALEKGNPLYCTPRILNHQSRPFPSSMSCNATYRVDRSPLTSQPRASLIYQSVRSLVAIFAHLCYSRGGMWCGLSS